MLSREQDNVQYYLASGTLLYEAFPSRDEAPLREGLFALDGAIANFGRAEMAIYQAERNRAAGQPVADDAIKTALETFHQSGLESLGLARDALGAFRRNIETLASDRGTDYDSELLERFAAAFDKGVRRELSYLELKPKDVDKLSEQLREALEPAQTGDPLTLIAHIEKKLEELTEVRTSDNRGMVDNIPLWKIIAVAVFFAITLWALIRCVWGWFGPRCGFNEGLIYTLIAKAAALGYKLC